MLFDEQQRPLPAERLLREAIATYQENENENNLKLAEAYQVYGFFFRSAAIRKWHEYYESHGFMEPGATYGNRYDKSIEYFQKSAAILEKHQKDDALTNVHLNMGFTYDLAEKPEQACDEYQKSLVYYQRNKTQHPDTTTELPKGVNSFEEYVSPFLKRLNCPS